MSILGNINIGERLGVGFAVILTLCMLITGIGVWRLDQLSAATHDMMEVSLAKERLISDWHSNLKSGVLRTVAIARSSDLSLGPYFAEDAKVTKAIAGLLQEEIEALISGPEETKLFKQISETRKVFLSSRDLAAKLKLEGRLEEADKQFQSVFVPSAATYQKLVQNLLKMQRDRIDAVARDVDRAAKDSRKLLLSLAVIV